MVEIYSLRLRVRRKRAKNHHKETRRVCEKKGTIETKKRRLALFDALAMQNSDWLFLKAKAAAISFQLVDMAYRLPVCPKIESLKCYSHFENPFLGMSRILLLVLRDNTKNGWV